MKKKNSVSKNTVVYFKKWQNRAFSVFSSLGKNVIIRTLPVIYVLMMHFPVFSQTDTISINEIVINSKRNPQIFSETARIIKIITHEEIQNAAVQSLDDLLEYTLGVDVRQRGAMGVQSDISIRGGSFEQVLVLINGVKQNNSQTGHHSFNLPIDIQNIERIEILEGAGARVYGQNAYSGAINIITNQPTEKSLRANLTIGQNNYLKISTSATFNIKKVNNYISVSHQQSSGYIENTDFDISNVFYSATADIKKVIITLQSGFLHKDFGAYNFYTPKYPNQAEEINSSFVSLSSKFGNKIKISPTIYWNRHQDRFELFRDDKDWYQNTGNYFVRNQNDTAKYVNGIYQSWNYYGGHNYHLTNTYGAEINSNFTTKLGKTSFGIDFSSENILSNKLGDNMIEIKGNDTTAVEMDVPFYKGQAFTKSKNRNNFSAFLDHSAKIKKFGIATGGLANWNSDFNWSFYSGIDLSFEIYKNTKIFTSANQSMRMPTFNDLYYNGPSNIGNPNLKPEEAITYEFGFKHVNKISSSHIAIFDRKGKNTIDWVKETEDQAKWQTMNYTNVNTYGGEFATKIFFNKWFGKNTIIQSIDLNYMYLFIDEKEQEFISKYVYDYLVHNASLSFSLQIYKGVGATAQINYQDREGSFEKYNFTTGETLTTNYEPIILANAKIYWNYKFFTIYTEATNILNTKYYDINNVQLPGTWMKAGINFKI